MDKELIYRFFEGKTSYQEEKQIKQWIESSDDHYALFLQERKMYDALLLTDTTASLKRKKNIILPYYVAGIAAAILLALIIGGVYLYTLTDKNEQYNTIFVPAGQRINLILSDNTNLWLNANTTFRYPTKFSKETRTVYLDGEAYFEVTTDKSRPFIVSTNDMEIEVFGTSFNVMAYPNDNSVETTLVEGSVKVKASKYNLVLEPGKQAKFDKILDNLQETKVNTELYTSWKVGKYIFEYENLQNVMTKLSRWYDAEITFLNTNAENLHFSGTLYKYNDIKQTLHIIELATNVKFEIIENTVLVSRK